MFGFGIPGQGFYSFNIPEAKLQVHEATGILTVLQGETNAEKINQELRHLVKEDWDFRVRKMDRQEYIVVFPDKNSLDTFSKMSDFGMSLHGLKGKLEKVNIDPATSSVLQTVWIRLSNVPGIAREVDCVKEMTALVAEPLVVDELSLIKAGPVRVQGRCRNPAVIRGDLEFFFNGTGYIVGFEVEGYQGGDKNGKGGPPGHGKPDDKHHRDHDYNSKKGDKPRKSNGKADRIIRIDKEADATLEESMEEELEHVDDNSNTSSEKVVVPIAAFHPDFGRVDDLDEMQELQNLSNPEDKGEIVANTHQIVVNGADGPYLMDKSKWPRLTVAEDSESQEKEPVESLTQEGADVFILEKQSLCSLKGDEMKKADVSMGLHKFRGGSEYMEDVDLMETISMHSKESDLEEDSQGWQTSKSKKSKKTKKKQVVVAIRTSNRIPRDGIPIADKAINRAIAKDNLSGIASQNTFTVLNNSSNSALAAIMADLDIEVENVDDQIDVFKAEELARAALAETNYKIYLESLKEKSKPQNESETENLAVGVIANSQREVGNIFTRGCEEMETYAAVEDTNLSSCPNEDSILEC